MSGGGFDQGGVYFFGDSLDQAEQNAGAQSSMLTRNQLKKQFKQFLREFTDKTNKEYPYKYRDQLKHNVLAGMNYLEVDVEDMRRFCNEEPDQNKSLFAMQISEAVMKQPMNCVDLFDQAAREYCDELTNPRPAGQEELPDVQVIFQFKSGDVVDIRSLRVEQMNQFIKVSGICMSVSNVKCKAISLTLQCAGCKSYLNDIPVLTGMEGYQLPKKCTSTAPTSAQSKCPPDPYQIVGQRSKFVNCQIVKLQETPEMVPSGETARHITLYVDRSLCEKLVPGNRCYIYGVYCIKRVTAPGKQKGKSSVGLRTPYVKVLGIDTDVDMTAAEGKQKNVSRWTREEEQVFAELSKQSNLYELMAKSIAPSIYGSEDIKKSIACMLFGGSRKRLPDGIIRRGDLNVLLLGDPGTAKSQLLKFVQRASPIAVYTSGKGSSAAGLTASVTKDASTRNFIVEGGAMVLADGGVVCIDEFDKLKPDDRVAIHEAMEQQTISIAKAGVTTTLNSRCSVLAAANSVFGTWDETRSADDNIDFMPTILSRFDCIFIVKDRHDQLRDTKLCKHVIQLAANNAAAETTKPTSGSVDKTHLAQERHQQLYSWRETGEVSVELLKRYVSYCRHKCGPRLSAAAADLLRSRYIMMRNDTHQYEKQTGKRIPIPITVRQLEALVRISESLAKMRLSPFATELDVAEALRLFQVSTLEAATNGHLAGVEGFTTEHDQVRLAELERLIKQRFLVGSQVAEATIVNDLVNKYSRTYDDKAVKKVLQLMMRRGEIVYRLQRRVIYRMR